MFKLNLENQFSPPFLHPSLKYKEEKNSVVSEFSIKNDNIILKVEQIYGLEFSIHYIK